VNHPFFLPFIRLELLIRSIRTTRWDLETWPTVKVELRRALSSETLVSVGRGLCARAVECVE